MRFSTETKQAAHVGDTLRTIVASCLDRNVLVLVKVDASVTAAEELTVETSRKFTTPTFLTQ